MTRRRCRISHRQSVMGRTSRSSLDRARRNESCDDRLAPAHPGASLLSKSTPFDIIIDSLLSVYTLDNKGYLGSNMARI